ncbi:MAG: TSUP family transporter [Desulfuromonadaceae bacterium]|nr:TSUP family transporter [Desulfuromonadaceae bacterium]MDD5104632.1 TSUP family transporter [Desulfuromonadaceae bacterium]
MSSEILLLLLFGAAFIAGLVDSIAGGGGLITVPVLMGIGLPPQVALGTNKLQASFGSGSAMLHFVRAGTVKLSDCWNGIIWTAIGAALGVWAVQLLDASLLKVMIPWLLAAIAIYTLLSPRLGAEDSHARMKQGPFYLLFGLAIGFYDGFFGPGTGSFWTMALMMLLGYSMMRATATTKVMNFTSNFVALIFFLSVGQVRFIEGIVMGVGQFMGARVGSKLVIKRGTSFIRPVFITMVLALVARLMYQNFK